MKTFNEYDQTEIQTIADKFQNGDFVTKAELKTWYNYRQAVQSALDDKKHWDEMDKTPKSLVNIFAKAEAQSEWIKTVKTFPLKPFCEYYLASHDHYNGADEWNVTPLMAQKVVDGVSPIEEDLIRQLFEESEHRTAIDNYRDLTTPVNLREWLYMKQNPTEYYPYVSACDATELYDGREHYIYIQSECDCHRWGETYWISVDCDNTLMSLPVIKDFKNYDFQIGGFYKIQCTDTIHFGGNKKKYVMDIQESTEAEFMEKGLHQYATREYY